jgi:hypothetical protein
MNFNPLANLGQDERKLLAVFATRLIAMTV